MTRHILSIHAHPDDQEFTVGGTLAKWARAGSQVVTVCITSGGAGSNDHTPPEQGYTKPAPKKEFKPGVGGSGPGMGGGSGGMGR